MRNLETRDEAIDAQRRIQDIAMSLGEHRIPAIFHMEGVCGAYIQGATSFPSGLARGAAWDPCLEKKIGEIVGEQERAVGITNTFAPVLDVSRDSRIGRQAESYSEDPTLISAYGSAFVRGIQKSRSDGMTTDAVAKHFLAFHTTLAGIHGASIAVDDLDLRETFAKPFQAAISEAGLHGIMPCYSSIKNQPVSASREILTDLLREEMGFDGLVESDYCAIQNVHDVQKVTESRTEAGLRSMTAGMDQELHFKSCFNDELMEWFKTGKADIAVLDRAVRRILEAKFRMGLFEHPYALDEAEASTFFGTASASSTALKSARESLVLLKNDGTLPLEVSKVQKIAVIGPHAINPRYLFSGYTHLSMAEGAMAAVSTMAGLQTGKGEETKSISYIPGTIIQRDSTDFDKVLNLQQPGMKSIYQVLEEKMPNATFSYSYGYDHSGTDTSYFAEALDNAKDADIVIATVGGKYSTSSIASEGEGVDTTNINLSSAQEEFIQRVGSLGKPLVLIHIGGRPISSDAADKYASSILEAWAPAEAGSEAIAEALVGEYNPGGKLPVSVAYTAGQLPLYYCHLNGSSYHQGESIAFADYVDMPHKPRYPFGYGLSYTHFEYSNMRVEEGRIPSDGSIQVSVDVKNAGDHSGDEVVQFYVKDRFASMIRPVLQLAGFERVYLEPGEERVIQFTLPASFLAFIDLNNEWIVEKGSIDLFAGSSSEDLPLQASVVIEDTNPINERNRAFYAKAGL
jgi:beta-glucosidase